MDIKLMDAVMYSKIEEVQALLEKGVNVNYVPVCGKTPLSTAAALGNINIMKLLLKADKLNVHRSKKTCLMEKQDVDSKWDENVNNDHQSLQNDIPNLTSFEHKKNLGYYTFVHNEDPDSNGCVRVINKSESLDAETPEEMEGLEWFMEVEGVEDPVPDDVWSLQYRWYADILDKTGGLFEEETRGCDVNLQDNRGRCAVHYAVECSQLEAVQCLISAGTQHSCSKNNSTFMLLLEQQHASK